MTMGLGLDVIADVGSFFPYRFECIPSPAVL